MAPHAEGLFKASGYLVVPERVKCSRRQASRGVRWENGERKREGSLRVWGSCGGNAGQRGLGLLRLLELLWV